MAKYYVNPGKGRSGAELVKVKKDGRFSMYREIGGSTTSDNRHQWIEVKSFFSPLETILSRGFIETTSEMWDMVKKIRKKSLQVEEMINKYKKQI